jgi:hypothetical protein
MSLQVGQTVKYAPSDDYAETPDAAIITKVHPDGHVCLVYWCNVAKAWKEAFKVSPFSTSNGDTNEPYFDCLD